MSTGETPEVKWTRYYEEPWTLWHPCINGFAVTPNVIGSDDSLHDTDGRPLYVGRAVHGDDLLPGKVSHEDKKAYVSFEGKVYTKEKYDVLFADGYYWKPAKNGQVPKNALEGGHTAGGETLYIGRAKFEGKLIPGRIQPSKGVIYIPVGDEEKSFKEYEVLYKDEDKMAAEIAAEKENEENEKNQ